MRHVFLVLTLALSVLCATLITSAEDVPYTRVTIDAFPHEATYGLFPTIKGWKIARHHLHPVQFTLTYERDSPAGWAILAVTIKSADDTAGLEDLCYVNVGDMRCIGPGVTLVQKPAVRDGVLYATLRHKDGSVASHANRIVQDRKGGKHLVRVVGSSPANLAKAYVKDVDILIRGVRIE